MDRLVSDNASGAVNQQERLDAYIAGFVDGEGGFHVAVQRNPSTKARWQLVPEFRVSQDVSRVNVLHVIRDRLDCGSLRENHRGTNDHTLVIVVRRRNDLLEKVIPFFKRNPLLSCKQSDFYVFAEIVRRMAQRDHLCKQGFDELFVKAIHMNGGGRYRRLHRNSESRILRDHMPSTVEVDGEEMVRPAWRHAELDRNDPVSAANAE
jgi:hypothetical protein